MAGKRVGKRLFGVYGSNDIWVDDEQRQIATEPSPFFFLLPPPPVRTAAHIDRLYDLRRPMNMFTNDEWRPMLDYYGQHLYSMLYHPVRWAFERMLVTLLWPLLQGYNQYKLNVETHAYARGFDVELLIYFNTDPLKFTSTRARFIRGLHDWLCKHLCREEVESLRGTVSIHVVSKWAGPFDAKDIVRSRECCMECKESVGRIWKVSPNCSYIFTYSKEI